MTFDDSTPEHLHRSCHPRQLQRQAPIICTLPHPMPRQLRRQQSLHLEQQRGNIILIGFLKPILIRRNECWMKLLLDDLLFCFQLFARSRLQQPPDGASRRRSAASSLKPIRSPLFHSEAGRYPKEKKP